MRFQMTERQSGRVTVLDLGGALTIDETQGLKDKINSLILQGRTAVLLNLDHVSYIDSGGLGQLAACYASVTKASGALKLLHVSKRNHDLLAITRLVTLFDTFDSEEEALRSFREPASSSQSPVVAG
jgi:anti-sigma B factor antagonist